MQFLAKSPAPGRSIDAATSLVIYRLNAPMEVIESSDPDLLILDYLDTHGTAPLADNAVTSLGMDRVPETTMPVALNYFVSSSSRGYGLELDRFYKESQIDFSKLKVAGFPSFYSFAEIEDALENDQAFFDPNFFLQDWLVEIDLDMLGSSDPDYVETLVDYEDP